MYYICDFYLELFTFIGGCLKKPMIKSAASHSKKPYAMPRPKSVLSAQIKNSGATRIAISATIKIAIKYPAVSFFIDKTPHRQNLLH